MLNKIGKVFKGNGLKAPKSMRHLINKRTGQLKNGDNFITKIAKASNNVDDIAGKVNATIPQMAGEAFDKAGNRVSNSSHKLSNAIKNAGQKMVELGEESHNISNLTDNIVNLHSVGQMQIGTGKFMQKAASFGSNASAKAREKIGGAIKSGGERLKKYEKAVEFDLKGAIAKDIKTHANQVLNFAGSLVEETDKNLLGVKLSGRGKMVATGAALVSGTSQGIKGYNQKSMGRKDNQITGHTPRLPAYANNAGATGDLVFALNANRRG